MLAMRALDQVRRLRAALQEQAPLARRPGRGRRAAPSRGRRCARPGRRARPCAARRRWRPARRRGRRLRPDIGDVVGHLVPDGRGARRRGPAAEVTTASVSSISASTSAAASRAASLGLGDDEGERPGRHSARGRRPARGGAPGRRPRRSSSAACGPAGRCVGPPASAEVGGGVDGQHARARRAPPRRRARRSGRARCRRAPRPPCSHARARSGRWRSGRRR